MVLFFNIRFDCYKIIIPRKPEIIDYGMCKKGLTKNEKTSTFCGTPKLKKPEIKN